MKIVRGKYSYQKLLPVMKKAFGINFNKIMPKIYSHPEYEKYHYAAVEGDKVIGCLGSLPKRLYVGDGFLKVRGIGNVGVLKPARGKGAMDKMMRQAVGDARAEGVDLMHLSGDRQRYQRYGFENVPNEHRYLFIKNNFKKVCNADFDFVRITEENALLKDAENIYNKQEIRYSRPFFLDTLKNWGNKYTFAVQKNNITVGHMVTGSPANKILSPIYEICLDEGADVLQVVKCYFDKFKKYSIKLRLFANQPHFIMQVSSVCQHMETAAEESFVILNYKNTLQKILGWQAKGSKGSYDTVISFPNGEKLEVVLNDGNVTVQDTDKIADVFLPELNCAGIVCSPILSKLYGLPFWLEMFMPGPDKV